MDTPTTRYARNGPIHLAYQVVGGGERDVIFVPSSVSQMEHLWEEPRVARILSRLASFSRLILFDRRGSGMSDRLGEPTPLEEQMDDARAVMAAAGSERAAFIAETEGTAFAVLFAATHPELVTALALYAPIPRFSTAADYQWARDPEAREQFAAHVQAHWGEGTTVDLVAPSLAGDARFRAWFGRLERLSAGPGAVPGMYRALADTDVRDVLPLVRAPTLVVRRRDDQAVDRRHAEFTVNAIPGARFVELPGADNFVAAGNTAPLLDALEEFLTGSRRPAPAERVLATVLFTDIVGSTERAAALGDSRWRELLEGHQQLVRSELSRFDGREVKTLGDGFLATFDGPARAVRCALAIAAESGREGVAIRAGLHTGECERLGDDVGGIAVHIAARVLALAAPGEVLVSRTVTDLVAGSGLEFSQRGDHALKGVPGEWQLFAANP